MTIVHLVRHAAHDHVGRILTGRAPGIGLSEEGREQAGCLAAWFEGRPVSAVETSPRERALETALAIGAAVGCEPVVVTAADEIDFGHWTGRSFAELEFDPAWRLWNERRAESCPPGGEPMAAVRDRIVTHLGRIAASVTDGVVVLVSHADVIKAALADALGLSLDHLHRFDIAPASVSSVLVGGWGARVLSVNTVPAR